MNDTPLFDIQEIPQDMPNNEWYTPAIYIQAAVKVMSGIDLDPASCEEANKTVKATKIYTLEDNGLAQEWSGRVWLNPPFTASVSCPLPQLTWASKLVREYHAGNVTEAILLIMAASKQHWFHTLWRSHEGLICFSEKRIHFNRPGNCTQELRESTCFVYLGPNESRFVEVFSKFGTIAKRVSLPKQELATALNLWSTLNTNKNQEESEDVA